MDPKKLKEELASAFDEVMEEKLENTVGTVAAREARKVVDQLRLERTVFGQDRTGLNEDQKTDFVEVVKASLSGADVDTKANEALISEQDNRGGYLVSREVADAILRVAASVGLVVSQAQRWPFGDNANEKSIPAYRGSFLEGEYLGIDAEGSSTALTFEQANLILKKWQLVFVMGNDLLADANVELADWLLGLAGEALANMADKQGFAGTGAPFVGLLESDDVTTFTLATGKTGFSDFDVLADSSTTIGKLEESLLDGAAFYMHRTVWADLRVQEDTAGNHILPMAGAPTNAVLEHNPTGGGVRPVGEVLGFPVFTSRHLPALGDSAVSTKFMVFGNMSAMAYGDKGEMRVEEYRSGSFGGKEIGRADQRAIAYKQRHAITIALPSAFVVVKTAAS